jgi:AraC family transcriptional regulator, regulatory protein of adaptative response / methylphosphotriester-DNA alkyltransferase methyltransferase
LVSLALAGAAGAPEPLGVELTDAEVIDDDGIALLVNGLRRLHHRRSEVMVVCPPGRVRRALERAGLTYRMTILDAPNGVAGSSLHEPPAVPLGPTGFTGHRHRRSTPARRATLLAEATLAIENRHADPTLTVRDTARQIGTSERQLQRVLPLAGSGFRDEVVAMRMQHAAALLQTTELPASEVARHVGYRQSAQFTKAFRRHHGSPPNAFRRTIGR